MAADEEVELWRLRKSLREEYAFVNQQKRALQKEYASIVSAGDSLSRSLWVNGQQWKNLQRLKGGPKFSSECVYSSNLLDAMSFVDGYVRVGFKEVKYGNFLRELKDNIALVKSILIFADQLNLDTSAFVRTMCLSLYGSCLFPGDKRSVLLIAKSIIEYHLVFSPNPRGIFRPQRNSFYNILNVLMETLSSARAFIVSACREVVLKVLLDGSMFWIFEEQELLSVMMLSEVRQKFGDPGSDGTTDRIKNYMDQSRKMLSNTINSIVLKVKENVDCLPDIFLWIVAYFYRLSLKRGLHDAQARIMVMRFLFEQVITPVLHRPQPLLIETEVRASSIALFNLRKVASVLQTFISIEAGEDLQTLSVEAKQFYEHLDRGLLNDVIDRILETIPQDDELTLSPIEDMPGIARTSVLMTKTDLDSLVIFFHKLQHQNHQLLDQENLKTVLSHVEGICSDITVSMANLNVSEQDADVQDELQTILHAFKKPFGENEEVLVISLGVPTVDCPGLLSEEKILGLKSPRSKRKAFAQPKADNIDESFDNLQLSDSDSAESSSDEKTLDMSTTEQDKEQVMGFEDSFVDSPHSPQQPVTQNNTFHEFDPLSTITNQDDPFLTVVSLPPAHVSPPPVPPPFTSSEYVPPPFTSSEYVPPPFTSSEYVPPSLPSPPVPPAFNPTQTNALSVGLLIDVDEPSTSPDRNQHSSLTSENFTNSSGSQSSSQSGKRFSSSASSGSDVGHTHSVQANKGKKDERRRSLKAGLQNVIKMHSPQDKRKKPKDASKPKKKSKMKYSKKGKVPIINATDVFDIDAAAVEQEKSAKDICDAILDKYKQHRHRRNSEIAERPVKKDPLIPNNAPLPRDEEEIMRDAKNKLRLVLSNGSTPSFPLVENIFYASPKKDEPGDELMTYLRKDLADAMGTRDCTMVARLHETLSTFKKLPPTRYSQLLKELVRDYRQRKQYVTYLIRSHQGLVATREYLENMLERVQRDREISRRYLMAQCVSMYLDECKEKLESFIRAFKLLTMADEKSEEMKRFLNELKGDFQINSLWLGSNEKQRYEANNAIERCVIARVYNHAVYPFGEPDKSRDDVFHTSVELLCNSIGEDFSSLDIKEEYQLEAPWYPAQYELFSLSAYKTPSDKLKCIERCYTTVMNLLAMSSASGAIGADSFTPVLIYVVMHANPKGLLTIVDFINNYLSEPLSGEQYYCWMQFCSAIQFIKILLEENNSKQV